MASREIEALHNRLLDRASKLNTGELHIADPTEHSEEKVHAAERGNYFQRISTKPHYLKNAIQHKQFGPFMTNEILKLVPPSVADAKTVTKLRAIYDSLYKHKKYEMEPFGLVPPFGPYQNKIVELPPEELANIRGFFGGTPKKVRKLIEAVDPIFKEYRAFVTQRLEEQPQHVYIDQPTHLVINAFLSLQILHNKLKESLGLGRAPDPLEI